MSGNDIIKRIKTSCPFPMLEFKSVVHYNEVRKASGIAYILLELMQKPVMKKEKIATVLLKFGIPTDLHHIFAKELSSLVANGIVYTRFNSSYIDSPHYFEQMTVSMFSLTPKGEKMFAEGAIPTGQEKAKPVSLFFSPVTRKFALICTQSYAPLETSFLGENFLDNIKYDLSGMEEYVKSVQTKIGLKAEEMIVSVEHGDAKKLVVKSEENLSITIDSSGVTFELASSDESAFFQKYYSSPLMSAGMLAKTKYKFESKNIPTIDFNPLHVDNIYIPADIDKLATRPCALFLNRNKLGISRTDNTSTIDNAGFLLDKLSENAEFALLDTKECKFYLPVNMRFHCKNFEDVFEMQVLVEKVAESNEFEDILNTIYVKTLEKDFSIESAKIIAFVSTALHDSKYLNDYTVAKLKELNSDEERIERLLKLNSVFAKCKDWKLHFESIAESLFNKYVEDVKIDNVIFKNTILTPLKKAMGMSDRDYISYISHPLKHEESEDIVYQALESAGFQEAEILSVANVVTLYMTSVLERKPIDSPTALAGKFSVLQVNLWKLCDMLGIEDTTNYSLRDDYNVDEFFNTFATFKKAYDLIGKYMPYSRRKYEMLSRYTSILDPIHDVLSVERTASEHPDKITRQFIDEQIRRGRYNVAISNLLIKAQYDLRTLLSAETTRHANELIDEAQTNKIITKDQANALHKLRMCRNGLQHPETKQVSFDKKSVELWRDVVFALKGEDK